MRRLAALLLLAGCNALFDLSRGTPRPLCEERLLIDDLEDGDGEICATDERVGGWYTFDDGTGEISGGPVAKLELARVEESTGKISRHAAHMTGSGFTGWGAGLGASVGTPSADAPSADTTPFDIPYDASALDGIRFWMKSSAPVDVAVLIPATLETRYGGECESQDAERNCNNNFIFSITAPNPEWAQYEVPFNALRQVTGSASWDPRRITGVQFAVAPQTEFDVWVDDLSFYNCAECQPTCTDPELPVSCPELGGNLPYSSCQPSGINCELFSLGLGDPLSVANAGGDPECVGQPVDQAPHCFLDAPTGMPFTTRVNPFTDGVSDSRLRNPEPGKVCMQGRLVAGGAAAISLVVSRILSDFPPLVEDPFDLQAFDIQAIEFRITNPPLGGFSLELRSLVPAFDRVFGLGPTFTWQGPEARFFESETVRAKLTEFEPADPGPGKLLSMYFWGHSASRLPTSYDFCLEGVRFLDSRGEVVETPPGR